MPPSLAQRLLFHASPNDPLPSLLSSPDVSPELTPELYDFLALALRAYVSPWWSKISRYDKDFLPHATRILIHVIQVLDQRTQQVDLSDIVFHDLPVILTQHYRDFRNAQAKGSSAYAAGGSASVPLLFSHLQPHMAISPDGTLNPEYYRQIIEVILKTCLPPEDYEPEVERIIIREVIIKVLLTDVVPKVIQPWFVYRSILDLLGPSSETSDTDAPSINPPTFSFQNIIVLALSALQSFSGMCLTLIHAYRHAITTIKLVHQSPSPGSQRAEKLVLPPESISASSSIKSERPMSIASALSNISTTSSITVPNTHDHPTLPSAPVTHTTTTPPNYAQFPLIFLIEITSALQRYASSLFFLLISMLATTFMPFLDKLLPYLLSSFLSSTFVLNILRTAKRTLFPNGYPGPQPPDPTLEEQAEIRARLIAWKGSGAVAVLWPLLLGPNPQTTLAMALEPLGNAQCNTHLFVFIFDRILLALFPELVGAPS